MVDIAKPTAAPGISVPSEPVRNIEDKDAVVDLLKRDAVRLGCNPEDLRCRVVTNTGTGQAMLEVERIPDDEVDKAIALDGLKQKRRKQIRRRR